MSATIWNFGTDAELMDDGRLLIRILDAPLHDAPGSRAGVSGVKPWLKLNAGASAPELAVMAASTSCGRLSPS